MSIRLAILESSPFSRLIREQFSDSPTGLEALAYAIEGHLRAVSGIGAIDGFESFYVLEETQATLKIVGSAYFLPSSLLPLDASFQAVNDGISYRVMQGSEDKVWEGLTQSKRWKVVHLYATEGHEPKWNWDQLSEGLLPS